MVGLGRLQGQFFLDDPGNIEVNGTAAMAYLLAHMPRRDLMLLFGRTLEFTDFLFENVRLALRVWPFSKRRVRAQPELLFYCPVVCSF